MSKKKTGPANAILATMTKPAAQDKVPALSDFVTFRINLPSDRDWTGTVFTVSAAWGNGNHGQDAWGWNAAGVSIGEVRQDAEGWSFLYSIQNGFNSTGQLCAIFRFIWKGLHSIAIAGPYSYRV